MRKPALFIIAALSICMAYLPTAFADTTQTSLSAPPAKESPQQRDARMDWWREARFGMFIHWGLYAIPAGEWNGDTRHAEWIRTTAGIPIETYDQFVGQFNPVKFNANEWARMAKDAGMRYIVITSKHHDGFCLFDSEYTDFDVMSTPFKRDIMMELSDACREHGLAICWYHSIMDWHHPDYLPRRGWEAANRPEGDANFDRFYQYLKNQVTELLTKYGPIGVMWFDGEWENTWSHARGQELYDLCRTIQPGVIVNNRVDVGRGGMAGMTKDGLFAGDFGTPEQEIPATGLPGVDWETCMTMNDHWGYNRNDHNWKSTEDLIRKLADIASKGGNFLLNVGPKADGTFPDEAIERLREIGAWMKVNGESIYGTQAGPFKALPWGRCTRKVLDAGDTRLYLHVFEWPADGALLVPGIFNEGKRAYLLAERTEKPLPVSRREDALLIHLPAKMPDPINTIVVLEIAGKPDISEPPTIHAEADIFVDAIQITIATERENVELRYTADGNEPSVDSPPVEGPIALDRTATVKARAFRAGKPVSGVAAAHFTKVPPRPAVFSEGYLPGLRYEYYEGEWDRLPDFDALTPIKTGRIADFLFDPRNREEGFAFRYSGIIMLPTTGVYSFSTISDDGSRLYIGDSLVVDNDGLHGMEEKSGVIALAAGAHPITVTYFERTGGDDLLVYYSGPGIEKQRIPEGILFSAPGGMSAQDGAAGELQSPLLVTPAPRQIAWQQMEMHAFVHFSINTFTDREWGDGREDPRLFNPSALDAGQWAETLRDAGFKGLILTAKHHDGFCLWPSKYTEHSVKNSPWRGGKGDLVREVADACQALGLKFGVYLSPWDRHEPTYGDSPRYNQHYMNQLTELLTNYGPIYEVWFDGACGEGPSGKRQVYDFDGYVKLIRKLQPDAVIFSDGGPDVRWVGNEQGFAGETNWSTLRRERFYPGSPNYTELTQGHAHGTHWVPAECDVSIRPGWFYHPGEDDQVKSLAQLLEIYYGSVGRNAVLLLNVPPDRRGLIHKNDAARLKEFHDVLAKTFAVDLARGKPAAADDVLGGVAEFAAKNVTDGRRETCWMPGGNARSGRLTIAFGAPATFDRILISERIELGQRVYGFTIEALVADDWKPIASGTTIGYKRLLRIEPVVAEKLRLTITDALAPPAICEVGVYMAAPREGAAAA